MVLPQGRRAFLLVGLLCIVGPLGPPLKCAHSLRLGRPAGPSPGIGPKLDDKVGSENSFTGLAQGGDSGEHHATIEALSGGRLAGSSDPEEHAQFLRTAELVLDVASDPDFLRDCGAGALPGVQRSVRVHLAEIAAGICHAAAKGAFEGWDQARNVRLARVEAPPKASSVHLDAALVKLSAAKTAQESVVTKCPDLAKHIEAAAECTKADSLSAAAATAEAQAIQALLLKAEELKARRGGKGGGSGGDDEGRLAVESQTERQVQEEWKPFEKVRQIIDSVKNNCDLFQHHPLQILHDAKKQEYGNWCGCNACHLDGAYNVTRLPKDEASFHACPEEEVGFDLANQVCSDHGLDQACLRHDYGAYSQLVSDYMVVNECQVNSHLFDAAGKSENSEFRDTRGTKETSVAVSIRCGLPLTKCLFWNGEAYVLEKQFRSFPAVDGEHSAHKDGCGPTGCYLYELEGDAFRSRESEVQQVLERLDLWKQLREQHDKMVRVWKESADTLAGGTE